MAGTMIYSTRKKHSLSFLYFCLLGVLLLLQCGFANPISRPLELESHPISILEARGNRPSKPTHGKPETTEPAKLTKVEELRNNEDLLAEIEELGTGNQAVQIVGVPKLVHDLKASRMDASQAKTKCFFHYNDANRRKNEPMFETIKQRLEETIAEEYSNEIAWWFATVQSRNQDQAKAMVSLCEVATIIIEDQDFNPTNDINGWGDDSALGGWILPTWTRGKSRVTEVWRQTSENAPNRALVWEISDKDKVQTTQKPKMINRNEVVGKNFFLKRSKPACEGDCETACEGNCEGDCEEGWLPLETIVDYSRNVD